MNDGFVNEEQLRNYINNNDWKTYYTSIKELLKFTFGNKLNIELTFTAEKIGGKVKPDMAITHNGTKKYISIKKGSGNSVHQEKISVFFPLIESLFDSNTLNNLKLFHYGDGTLDDSGTIRYSASECQIFYSSEIASLNNKFNEWDKLKIFLDRFLFVGNISSTLIVDVIYHGNINSGIWASRDELYKYFENNLFSSSALHFGSLTYQVWGRNNDFRAVHPDRRYVMQVKWGEILNDLNKIKESRNYE